MRTLTSIASILALLAPAAPGGEIPGDRADPPWLIVLGIAQDGGYPQAGTKESPAWDDPSRRRLVVSLGLVDPVSSKRWLFEATPDFKEELHRLDAAFPVEGRPGLDGIFLTHGHMGHYTGLVHLGREALGTRGVKVYAMPRMAEFLTRNGPWEQLVRLENVVLEPLAHRRPLRLNPRLEVTPILVPHRDEYTETVAFRIAGPNRAVLFLPDVDKWEKWDAAGERLEDVLETVDVAYLDGSFYSADEIPGRDMAEIPHPSIPETMARLAALPAAERAKVRFIHLNRTNPALDPGSEAVRQIEAAGFAVARELERVDL